MDKKAWIIFSVVVVVLFGALIYLSNQDNIDVSRVDTSGTIAASETNGNIADHVFGKQDSKVVLVEYGDYQCPGCGSLYPTLKTLSEKYQGQLAFVFRNFPLTSIHPNARAAAAAAEAAGLQGKYWEMHNTLYENQSAWESLSASERTDAFTGYARTIGLDTTEFKASLSKANVNQKISFDQSVGKKVGVSGTPSIYLNGTQLDQKTWADEAAFEKAIKSEFQVQGITLTDK